MMTAPHLSRPLPGTSSRAVFLVPVHALQSFPVLFSFTARHPSQQTVHVIPVRFDDDIFVYMRDADMGAHRVASIWFLPCIVRVQEHDCSSMAGICAVHENKTTCKAQNLQNSADYEILLCELCRRTEVK